MKKCNVCEVEKPLTEYYKRNDSRDGYYNSCKKCYKLLLPYMKEAMK